MEEARRVLRIVITLCLGLFVFGGGPGRTFAKEKPKAPASAAAKGGPPPGESVNACGCYHNARGGCVCTDKKGKCECPGDCEPVGCGEKRDKEMEREMAVEIKRAQEDEKKRQEALEAQENGTAPDASTPPAAEPSAPKPSRKDAPAKPQKK
jgi:hypothetical protein